MSVTNPSALSIAMFDAVLEGFTAQTNFVPVTGFPATALREPSLFNTRLRTSGLTNQTLTWDCGVAVEANVFMLAGNNATLSATGQLQGANDSGFTVDLISSSPGMVSIYDTSLGSSRGIYTPPWGRVIVVVLSESYSRRYWRWTQSDPTNPNGYQEWAIAELGLAVQLEIESWKEDPKTMGNGFQLTLRGHDITFAPLDRDKSYTMKSLSRLAGTQRRMLVIPETLNKPAWIHDALWCTMERTWESEFIVGTDYSNKYYKAGMVFREAHL